MVMIHTELKTLALDLASMVHRQAKRSGVDPMGAVQQSHTTRTLVLKHWQKPGAAQEDSSISM